MNRPLTAVTLLRPEDSLVMCLLFEKVVLDEESGPARLVRKDPAAPSYVQVTLPPQALLEQALPSGASAPDVLGARFGRPSYLKFSIGSLLPVPFTAADLLTLIRGAALTESSLEIVWDLRVKIAGGATVGLFDHLSLPTVRAGVADLWHTRLTRPAALEAAGYPAGSDPFPSSLTARQRQLVAVALATRPLTANELTLTPIGATIDVVGDWSGDPNATVQGYRHRAVVGRDAQVEIAETGFLFPFGFAVRLTTSTARRIESGFARLRQVSRLSVQVPVVIFERAVGLPHEGRAFPFRSARLTAPLAAEVVLQAVGPGIAWINTPGGTRLGFDVTLEDYGGRLLQITIPMIFVDRARAFGDIADAVNQYHAERVGVPVPTGGRLAFAKDSPADSVLDLTSVYVSAERSTAGATDHRSAQRLAAYPRLHRVDARLPALDAFARSGAPRASDGDGENRAGEVARGLTFDQDFLDHGFQRSGVYATLTTRVPFDPPPAAAGGLAQLAFPISGLARGTGLVGGDIAAFKNGGFDPGSFFAPDAAMPSLPMPALLGFLPLAQVVLPARAGDGMPQVVTEIRYPAGDRTKPPESVQSTVTWRPVLRPGEWSGLVVKPNLSTLYLRSATVVDLRGGPPVAQVSGEMTSFDLKLAGGTLIVTFERLAFSSRSGAAPTLEVKIGAIQFGGHLRLLDQLRRYLVSPSNGPRVVVTPAGVEVGYSLAVPSVAIGAFLLQNLALAVRVVLPIDRAPAFAGPTAATRVPAMPKPVAVTFEVSSRDHPFLLTVSAFGGGGFVALTLEGNAIKLEAELVFGAAVALDLLVASASVSVTGGLYLNLVQGAPKAEGSLRVMGELDVLGLINVSLEVTLKLEYLSEEVTKLRGRVERRYFGASARVTVRVRLFFISKSVTVSISYRFSDGSDPTFDVAFPTAEPWRKRAAAFAPMVPA